MEGVVLVLIAVIIVVILLFLRYVPLGLWINARASGAPCGITGSSACIAETTTMIHAMILSIDSLLSDALTEQTVHTITDAHQIDATAQHTLQFCLNEVERKQRWSLAFIAHINIAIIGLFATSYGTKDTDARQSVLALCRRLIDTQQM